MKFKSTMYKLLFIPAFIFAFGTINANAQTNAGDFGIGVIIGEPTGISAKYFAGGNHAFDFGLAWSLGREDNFHFHADYLIHRFDLINVESGRLPFYYGIGGRLRTGPGSQAGIRFPLGLSYYFPKDPIEIFFEIVPILDLTPDTDISGNSGVGVRFYFSK